MELEIEFCIEQAIIKVKEMIRTDDGSFACSPKSQKLILAHAGYVSTPRDSWYVSAWGKNGESIFKNISVEMVVFPGNDTKEYRRAPYNKDLFLLAYAIKGYDSKLSSTLIKKMKWMQDGYATMEKYAGRYLLQTWDLDIVSYIYVNTTPVDSEGKCDIDIGWSYADGYLNNHNAEVKERPS